MYVYLDFALHFQCEMCGRCCRNNWMVTIDEDSYRRNAEFFLLKGNVDEFRKAFKRLEERNSPGEFACIEKQPEGKDCWFLENDNLCRLQKEAGHDHLDAVCQTFPRYPISSARGIELTLSFSCPAVIKRASLRPLQLIRSQTNPFHQVLTNYVAEVYPHQQPLHNPLRYYFELEQHFIDIIQWRGFAIADRLKLLEETVYTICSRCCGEESGRELTAIINRNYEKMDTNAEFPPHVSAADILIENFFVNAIFKKLFYLHGLSQAMQLFWQFWHHITARKFLQKSQTEYDLMAATLIELEFEYSHNRTQFNVRQTNKGQ